MNKFVERLLELRREKGVTQIQVAQGAGLSNGAIANYELSRRTPTMHGLIALADYFGCSLDYLVGRSEDF